MFSEKPLSKMFLSYWRYTLFDKAESQPFYAKQSKQMELITDFEWILFKNLKGMRDDLQDGKGELEGCCLQGRKFRQENQKASG